MNFRYYTHPAGGQLAAGLVVTVMFDIDRPPPLVWQHLKDFNCWQNSCGHFYSGVLGELEGRTFRLSNKPNDDGPHQYRVIKVIPEHLIVLEQPGPWDGGVTQYDGYGVFMLLGHADGTTVSITMQHAVRTDDMDDERSLNYWRQMETVLVEKWRDSFVSNLTKLVHEGRL